MAKEMWGNHKRIIHIQLLPLELDEDYTKQYNSLIHQFELMVLEKRMADH
jgi:hypothetical protein